MSDDGEDPSPRPKRKIKKVMVLSSASSSDSDDSGPTTSTRKKRLRVLSEDGSDSSSGSWAVGAIRRRRALPGLRDSEGDSDSSGWATDHSDVPQASTVASASPSGSKSPSNKATKAVSGFSSDSSEGNSEKCSICLMKFLNQEVGTPQNCEHIFCLDCITEWSQNMNTCPVDRITFDAIVVRACAGGRVLRTEQVKVAERRPSLEMMIIEDPTVCEVCHNADREESMLLCDGCDLGFHMQCLTPPLTRVPEDQWLCPSCNGVWRSSPIFFPIQSQSLSGDNYERSTYERASRATREDAEPSTSSGRRRSAAAALDAPATSRRARALGGGASSSRRATAPRARTRKYKRRKTRTVIVEYEVRGEGKFPITKTKRVKTRIKKRRKTRQPRTAARRSLVRASVRARLAALRGSPPPRAAAALPRARAGTSALSSRRAGAGIAPLSLFGSARDLDYFEEEEEQGSEAATAAVAARPTSAILDAYRQARRKMVSVPSPRHASSPPDILSNILESQALLHSRRSVVSVTVDGSLNIKLQTRETRNNQPKPDKKEDILTDKKEVDLTKGGESTKQAPAYPGQGRGWGGGYRYPRDQNNHHQNHNQGNQGYGRGGYDNGYGGPQQRGPGGGGGGGGGQYDRRDDNNGQFNDYHNRRPHQYSNDDEPWQDRNRRQQLEQNRGHNNNQREDRRFSGGPAWQPQRRDPLAVHRQSFGGFENPLDMRMGNEPPHPAPGVSRSNSYPEGTRDKPYQPLPQPPTFEFNDAPDRDKSEDEKSDEGLVIDTEKYDPTEPTNDDDSGDDSAAPEGPAEEVAPEPDTAPSPPAPPPPPPPLPPPTLELDVAPLPPPPLPPAAPSVERILAGIDTRCIDVPAEVLDSAVRQVLEEHRALLGPAARASHRDGDCPNFSIYSATSVHIASDSTRSIAQTPPHRRNSLEDLVQEDGDLTPPPTEAVLSPAKPAGGPAETTEDEYKAKISKRCPITTSTRNPIKIKLNTPSLIKRQVTLYDDEDLSQEIEENVEPPTDTQREPSPEAKRAVDKVEDEKVESQSEIERRTSSEEKNDPKEDKEADEGTSTPHISDEEATPARPEPDTEDKDPDDERTDDELEDKDKSKSESESEASSRSGSPRSPRAAKMTESISETEDERSYTPCLDENKSKDASLEDKGIEGLDTEMISEEEGNDMFSEGSPPAPNAPPPEEGEILDKRPKNDDTKKKKKNSKKEKDGKSKGRKRSDVAFKKIGKGKERNYRERDKEADKKRSPASSRERRRRKDKRKDLERYDVRTLVTERRRRTKDAFGRDVSPSGSRSPSPAPPALSPSPRRTRLSPSPRRTKLSPSPRRPRFSLSPRRGRLSPSPRRSRLSPSPRRARLSPSPRRARLSPSPRRSRLSPSPRRARFSPSPLRRRASTSPRRPRLSPSPRRSRISPSPRGRGRPSPSPRRGRVSLSPRRPASAASPSPKRRRKRSGSRPKATRRRRSTSRVRKRRRSASPASPKPTKAKKKKRARSKAGSKTPARRRSPRRKRARRRSASPLAPPPAAEWAAPPERALSPRTPPPAEPIPLEERRRRREVERAHRRLREAAGPSKEVFTSGDNILVSVSFKEQERAEGIGRRSRRKERRRRRRRAAEAEAGGVAPKPVAIIDLERSPFRELTPSPKNVIVLSDDEAPPAAPAPEVVPAQGPKTPPEPSDPPAAPPAPAAVCAALPAPEASPSRGPLTPPEPPDSPDAYDPYEPTRSASASPSAPAAAPAPTPADDDRPSMTLEAAQKTNLSADEVLDRRPLSPIEKVMALLQSTRDVSPEEPTQREAGASPGGTKEAPAAPAGLGAGAPAAGAGATAAVPPAPRIMFPDQLRPPPKLFLAKPSPIKSDPIKPMPQATKISRLPLPAVVAGVRRRSASSEGGGGASPYSPGSSDFGDLFEPPPPPRKDSFDALVDKPARTRKGRNGKSTKRGKKSKTTVDVRLDDDSLKILEELPSSAVEMQVKSKVSNFLKKLNRQERVVEEVKLVLKPHYNKKHVTKDEYKHILRRAVPKICHNKTGEINPTKIQALVEAYVKKFRKKRKLGQ